MDARSAALRRACRPPTPHPAAPQLQSLRKTRRFEGAQLQLCREGRRIGPALAAEGRSLLLPPIFPQAVQTQTGAPLAQHQQPHAAQILAGRSQLAAFREIRRNVENLSSFSCSVRKFCPTFHTTSTTIPSKNFGRFPTQTWYPDNRGQRIFFRPTDQE